MQNYFYECWEIKVVFLLGCYWLFFLFPCSKNTWIHLKTPSGTHTESRNRLKLFFLMEYQTTYLNFQRNMIRLIVVSFLYSMFFFNNLSFNWVVPTKINNPPTKENFAVQRAGEGNCLKKMSKICIECPEKG